MDTQNTLGLQIPERLTAPSDTLFTNTREVEAWIASLPVANVGETSRQVYKALVEFNRQDIPNPVRIKIAELFRKPIRYICDNLAKHYYDIPFPLSAKNRKISALNRELYSELAISYKIFIELSVSGRGGRFDKKMLIVAIHRTMHYLLQILYNSAIVYDPYPKLVWQELHRLYAYAEQNGVHTIHVKDKKERKPHAHISDLYLQALLFAASSPYNRRQREIRHIFHQLPNWSQYAGITTASPPEEKQGFFVSQLWTDSPPLHFELYQSELDHRCRLLDTRELTQYLREVFDQTTVEFGDEKQQAIDSTATKQLYRKLIQAYSEAPKRRFTRTTLNFELKAAVGLSAIHSLMKKPHQEQVSSSPQPEQLGQWINGQIRNPGFNTALYTSDKQVLSLGDEDEQESEETILAGSISASGYGQGVTPGWAAAAQEKGVDIFSCSTINESAGGYCINWQGSNVPKIKVGELLGIRSTSSEVEFSIGITRWLHNAGKGFQLGIEIISPNSVAVYSKTKDSSGATGPLHKSLLLPEHRATGQSASLITSATPFQVGDEVWIEDGTEEYHVRLTRLLESSGAFSQFQFAYMNKETGESDDTVEEEIDFENIWPML